MKMLQKECKKKQKFKIKKRLNNKQKQRKNYIKNALLNLI